MPPRVARKKTAVAKRRVCTPSASSSKVEAAPLPIEETTAPKADSFLEKDQNLNSDPIMTAGSAIESLNSAEEGKSSESVTPTRSAKKRAVEKVKASGATVKKEAVANVKATEAPVKKEAVASVVRDQIEQKTESFSEKEVETEKLQAKDVKDSIEEEPIEEEPMEEELEVNAGQEKEKLKGESRVIGEGERSEEKIGERQEIEEGTTKKEVENQGEKIENMGAKDVAKGGEIEEDLKKEEPVEEEEEPIEEEEIEEEPVEEEELIEEELVEEELNEEEEEVDIEEPMEQEPIEEEEEEEEEEPIEVEIGEGDGKEELTKGENNEEKRDIVAVKDVQPASGDGKGGEGEDRRLGDEPEPAMYMQALLPNRRVKETEIFVSQLAKTAVEEDIVKVFAGFGEIKSVKVIRHTLTQKSKGYAFVQYSTAEAVEKALSQLKDGAEINGKTARVSASNPDNCTLFVGNICKAWSKDQVLDALKGLGIEGIEHIALPEDPTVEGKIKGFAFVEFCTHIDARAAFNRLCKPDAVLGCDFSAKVSFAQFPVNNSDELLAEVKTVYLEPIPASWDGKKVEEICKEYGAIERIKLYRKSKSSKKRDFAFVEFVSRESALNCIEGLNKALVGHDDTKVSASLARPHSGKAPPKFMLRGNFKVKKGDEKVEKEGVEIIEISRKTKKKPKLKVAIAQQSKVLSPQKAIKKNKKANKKVPQVEMVKEAPVRHAPKKRPFKEAPVPVHPQGSKKRPFKEAPESSKRSSKGKLKHEKGMQGGPPPHQSGAKKSKPFNDRKQQHQRGQPSFNNERVSKRSRNNHHGNYRSHGSPIDRRAPVVYAYAPPPYTSSIPEPSRHEQYAHVPGSYHSHRSDLAPHAGYIPPTHHTPPTRHVYEQRPVSPAYGGVYERARVYTREPPIPPTSHPTSHPTSYQTSQPTSYQTIHPTSHPTSHSTSYQTVHPTSYQTSHPTSHLTSYPGYATYPRYEQTSYLYPTGGPYPAGYAPRRPYY